MTTSKDFRGSGSHRQLFHPYWGPPAWHSHWVNEQGKPASQKRLTAEVSAKQSIKCQLHTTHVGAVGWKPNSSSTTTCAGKVDHELPVNHSKGCTYTNPRPSHYLTYAHSHITRAVTAMGSCFTLTGAHQHGIQHMSALMAGNRMAILPQHARGRQIMGLAYVCPLL